MQAAEYEQLESQIAQVDKKLKAWHRADARSKRLTEIPGVGPIGAMLLSMKAPAPELFASGRQFAAWMGLTPRNRSTGGRVRLGVITRAGDKMLRTTLIAGATSLLKQVRAGRGRNASPWLLELLKRKPPKVAAVALANKIARIAWKMMVSGQPFKRQSAEQPVPACAG